MVERKRSKKKVGRERDEKSGGEEEMEEQSGERKRWTENIGKSSCGSSERSWGGSRLGSASARRSATASVNRSDSVSARRSSSTSVNRPASDSARRSSSTSANRSASVSSSWSASASRGSSASGNRCGGSQKSQAPACRQGYTSVQDRCYKFVRERLDWQTAALNCGADGAGLARYDSDVDRALDKFLQKVPQLQEAWIGGNTRVVKFGQRSGKVTFQVDPPLLGQQDGGNKEGCFQASLTKCGMVSLKVNGNCEKKLPSVCGYDNSQASNSERRKSTVFTRFYDVNAYKSIIELRENFRRLQRQDFVCDRPALVRCRARAGNRWVTGGTNTLKCTKNEFSCQYGRELDCSTFQVSFQCPKEENQCQVLKDLGAQVCDGGRQCFPAPNHFVCRCPPDHMYSEESKKCIKFCGECSAWGDPHYTTLNGKKYDFMGTCKYKFTGVCNQEAFRGRPNFDVLTTNVHCLNSFRPDGTCLDRVEVKLRNLPVKTPCGATVKKDYVFSYKVDKDEYQLNGETVKDSFKVKEGVFKAVVRGQYFSLSVSALDLTVSVTGNHLRVRVPETFRGNLCGLCGDCGTDEFKLQNGKKISVEQTQDRKSFKWNAIKPVALDWMVDKDQFKGQKCDVIMRSDTCSKEEKASVSGKNLCGLFNDKNSVLQKCFDQTDLRQEHYYHGCIYDLCEAKDPSKALCGVIESFAQDCAAKGVVLSWRRKDFCPKDCGPDKVYHEDASCQKTCGMGCGWEENCDEEPAEGCVCKDGLYRLGDRCVPRDQCN